MSETQRAPYSAIRDIVLTPLGFGFGDRAKDMETFSLDDLKRRALGRKPYANDAIGMKDDHGIWFFLIAGMLLRHQKRDNLLNATKSMFEATCIKSLDEIVPIACEMSKKLNEFIAQLTTGARMLDIQFGSAECIAIATSICYFAKTIKDRSDQIIEGDAKDHSAESLRASAEIMDMLNAGFNNLMRCINELYHSGRPIMNDSDYDYMIDTINFIQSKNNNLTLVNTSPLNIHTPANGVAHSIPMLSLEKIHKPEDLKVFLGKVRNYLKSDDPVEFCGELKIDGMAFAAVYENGKYTTGITRGDGRIGEDLTNHIANVADLPKNIPMSGTIEVRGEIYMTHADFASLNSETGDRFSTPRNFVAGSFRSLDPELIKSRKLQYFAYSLLGTNSNTHSDSIELLKTLGFSVGQYRLLENESDIQQYFGDMQTARPELPYDTDGIVIKVNNVELQNRLGSTQDHPRWAAAYKFASIQKTTIVQNITFQVGRTGAITPVAELKSIELGGVEVSRATLHNFEDMEKKGISVGSTVLVERAGDVIPRVVSVISPGTGVVKIPDECPSCQNKLTKEQDEVILRCTYSACPAQMLEKLIHFASRDAMDIMGLGDKQLAQLFHAGIVTKPSDIFMLTNDSFSSLPRWGEKSINKILTSIQKSRNTSLDRVIFALGIRHTGKDSAKILAARSGTLKGLAHMALSDTESIADINKIGPSTVKSIKEFFSNSDNMAEVTKLSDILTVEPYKISEAPDNILKNKTLVFTGKLLHISRDEAKDIAGKMGAHVSSAVSNKTDYVVLGEDAGSKLSKAKQLGITVMTEDEWLKIIGWKM